MLLHHLFTWNAWRYTVANTRTNFNVRSKCFQNRDGRMTNALVSLKMELGWDLGHNSLQAQGPDLSDLPSPFQAGISTSALSKFPSGSIWPQCTFPQVSSCSHMVFVWMKLFIVFKCCQGVGLQLYTRNFIMSLGWMLLGAGVVVYDEFLDTKQITINI